MITDNDKAGPSAVRRGLSPVAIAIRLGVLAALTVGLTYVLDFRKVPEYLSVRLVLAVLAAQPILILGCLIFAVRLQHLIRQDLQLASAFSAFVLPIGLNVILPARLSELVKPAYLNRAAGVPVVQGMAAFVLERALDVAALGLLALVVLPGAYLSSGRVFWIGLAVGIAALLPILSRLSVDHVFPRLPVRLAPLARFAEVLGSLGGFKRYGLLFGISAAGWIASLLSVHVVLVIAGSLPASLGQSSTVFLLTILGGLIAVLPAGVGTFQAAAMVGLVSFGFSAEESLVLAIGLQAAALLFPFAYLVTLLLIGSRDIDVLRDFSWRKKS